MANPVQGDWSFSGKAQSHLPPKSPVVFIAGGGGPSTASVQDNSGQLFSSCWPNFGAPYNLGSSGGGSGRNKQHQRTPSAASLLPQTPPSWIDDLLSDPPPDHHHQAPAKKQSSLHRRSSSDSVAFLVDHHHAAAGVGPFSRIDEIGEDQDVEFSLAGACNRINPARPVQADRPPSPAAPSRDFDKLDEEQLMSMFEDIETSPKQQQRDSSCPDMAFKHKAPPVLQEQCPSTPSDHNSVIEHSLEEKGSVGGVGLIQGEPEVQSVQKLDNSFKGDVTSSIPIDPSLDPKRAKRILANRQSAQRSRVRKLQYIAELERSVNALQAEVSALSPQVTYLDHQRVVLNVDNGALKQRIAALAQEKLFKDAHYDALKNEAQRLRQLYQQQQRIQDMSYDLQHQQLSHNNMADLISPAARGRLINSGDVEANTPTKNNNGSSFPVLKSGEASAAITTASSISIETENSQPPGFTREGNTLVHL